MASRPTTRTSARTRGSTLNTMDGTVSAASARLTRNAVATAGKEKASLVKEVAQRTKDVSGSAAGALVKRKIGATSSSAVQGVKPGLNVKSVNTAAVATTAGTGHEFLDITNNDHSSRSQSVHSNGSQNEKGKAPAQTATRTAVPAAAASRATAVSRTAVPTVARRPATTTTASSIPTAAASRPVKGTRRVVASSSTAPTANAKARRPATSVQGTVASASTAATQRPIKRSASGTFSTRESQETVVDSKGTRIAKRVKVEAKLEVEEEFDVAPKSEAEPPKDAGWEDLDKDDFDDPLMVAEYVNEIFDYMKSLEVKCMPSSNYIESQSEITWQHRSMLIDWLINVHTKFRLVPETLFLAVNIIDRMLSLRHIGISKLQLVGCTAVFIAAKYEEVLCPSIQNFHYLSDTSYSEAEILAAERYVLRTLGFNLSYANPMNFLRRISKADDYDIQTRTVAKFFMEISTVEFRLLCHPPSVIAAAAVWLAREVLERGPWTPTLVHYSSFTERELLSTAELMLDHCLRPCRHPSFHKKYSGKKFMRAVPYVMSWATHNYGQYEIEGEPEWDDELAVDLFVDRGLERPSDLELREIFGIAQAQREEMAADEGEGHFGSPSDDELADGGGSLYSGGPRHSDDDVMDEEAE